jgi:hypothetical protein
MAGWGPPPLHRLAQVKAGPTGLSGGVRLSGGVGILPAPGILQQVIAGGEELSGYSHRLYLTSPPGSRSAVQAVCSSVGDRLPVRLGVGCRSLNARRLIKIVIITDDFQAQYCAII